MQLGQTIKNIRKENNMTQDQFAKLFHVTRQTVSNWENEKSYPDLLTLVQISDDFNISLDHMLKENKVMAKKLNNQIKFGRIGKNIVIVAIALVVIMFGTRFLIWNQSAKRSNDKFTEGLKQYEYSIDETVKRGGYYIIDYDKDTYFALPHHTTVDFTSL
ncbi:MAG: helix-turn-helix transcriptional regulator, partial [Lachnospiraceae bacterium]|nr:helix-turn-helix transcriptional regulator [Lachnospiraceae bacterium]